MSGGTDNPREPGDPGLSTPDASAGVHTLKPGVRITSEPADLPPAPVKMETRGVRVYYGEDQALRGVDLAVREHEITAVIGPSGSGKSSLLRCLNRMNDLVPQVRVEGQVLLEGQDIYAPDVDGALIRRRVGMVFQTPNPFPLTVFENVAYGPRRHGITDRAQLEGIVEDSLRKAALWDEIVQDNALRRTALGLSGGQQQRVCLARVLAVEPEVILMDEPASALDPISAYRIEELMLQLRHSYTIVLVTRNLFQASRVADTTGVLIDGQLIEYGSTPQIFERPRDKRADDYVRGRIG